MKSLKEFKPLIKLIGDDKKKLVFASILIFISGVAEIFTGYLNGSAIESITNNELKQALIYLGLYFLIELTIDGSIYHFANSILYKIESALTRKLGFFTYKKALDLPAKAYEEKSSGEIINRITNDADIIHIVDKGRIVASGTHNELLKTNKIYKNLYETESLNS